MCRTDQRHRRSSGRAAGQRREKVCETFETIQSLRGQNQSVTVIATDRWNHTCFRVVGLGREATGANVPRSEGDGTSAPERLDVSGWYGTGGLVRGECVNSA